MLKRLFLLGAAIALPALAQPAAPLQRPEKPPHPPAFEDIDADKDGKLTPDEFRAFARAGCRPDIDSNADGKVSLEEFLVPAKAHFAEIDTNKNGFIDGDEKPDQGRKGGEGLGRHGGKGPHGDHRGPPPSGPR